MSKPTLLSKKLLMIYFVPGTVLDAVDTEINKTDAVPVLMKFIFLCEKRDGQ